MNNLNNVSQFIQNAVKEIAKQGGNKKQIDSQAEFSQLSELLARGDLMNSAEREYITGFMVEYQNKVTDQQISKGTKETISNIAKRTYNKKLIDSDEEANALALLLRNTGNILNATEVRFIKNLLIESGYGNYVEEFSAQETYEELPQVPITETHETSEGAQVPTTEAHETTEETAKIECVPNKRTEVNEMDTQQYTNAVRESTEETNNQNSEVKEDKTDKETNEVEKNTANERKKTFEGILAKLEKIFK